MECSDNKAFNASGKLETRTGYSEIVTDTAKYVPSVLNANYIVGCSLRLPASIYTNENTTIYLKSFAIDFDGNVHYGVEKTLTDEYFQTKGTRLFKE